MSGAFVHADLFSELLKQNSCDVKVFLCLRKKRSPGRELSKYYCLRVLEVTFSETEMCRRSR